MSIVSKLEFVISWNRLNLALVRILQIRCALFIEQMLSIGLKCIHNIYNCNHNTSNMHSSVCFVLDFFLLTLSVGTRLRRRANITDTHEFIVWLYNINMIGFMQKYYHDVF